MTAAVDKEHRVASKLEEKIMKDPPYPNPGFNRNMLAKQREIIANDVAAAAIYNQFNHNIETRILVAKAEEHIANCPKEVRDLYDHVNKSIPHQVCNTSFVPQRKRTLKKSTVVDDKTIANVQEPLKKRLRTSNANAPSPA